MGVGAGLYMYVVVVQKFTFAISSPDEFLSFLSTCRVDQPPASFFLDPALLVKGCGGVYAGQWTRVVHVTRTCCIEPVVTGSSVVEAVAVTRCG